MLINEEEPEDADRKALAGLVLMRSMFFYCQAKKMLCLDSILMDINDDHWNAAGCSIPLEDITIDSYQNDDECAAKTRFNKGNLRTIIAKLELPEEIQIVYHWSGKRWHRFRTETLAIYMILKMSSARTHVDLVDNKFGGWESRWSLGYRCMVDKFHNRFFSFF